jgi:hypothetical protein
VFWTEPPCSVLVDHWPNGGSTQHGTPGHEGQASGKMFAVLLLMLPRVMLPVLVQAIKQSGGLLRCCNNLTLSSSAGMTPAQGVEALLAALGESWHLGATFLQHATTGSASSSSSKGTRGTAAHLSNVFSASAAHASTVGTDGDSSRGSSSAQMSAAEGDASRRSSSGTWALHLSQLHCTRAALTSLPQGLTSLELK